MKNNQFVNNSSDLVTTKDARRSGFLEYALRRNKESIPFIDKAKALQVSLQKNTKCAEDILKLYDIRETLIEAAGVSVKAKAHLDDMDKNEILAGFVKEVLAPCGKKYIDEIVYRYLLTLGDALGGKCATLLVLSQKRNSSDLSLPSYRCMILNLNYFQNVRNGFQTKTIELRWLHERKP